MSRFIVSLSIFIFAWLPMLLIGLPVVALMLLTAWDGKTTWFGNYLYGRKGNSHMPPNPSRFDEWSFLALRNPISNFGKFALARGKDSGAWLIDKRLWRIGILYGWKLSDPRLPNQQRPFVFRPYFK